ncbi:hypothetical protein DBR18_27480 [Pseudomonas sp. HMWF021]|jgi:hypothetical protein|nr:hypothetical protein DBR18_27480 [Pseudomonas sp. HMWF021]
MQAGDKLTVTWTGAPGTPAEGSHTTALINAGTQPQPIPLPNSVVAFNLNKTVTVTYTVTRGGVALPTSPALTLSVLALPVSALPKPRILQAADAGNGIELNVANLTGNATLRFDPWGLIAIRQSVFLSLNGTYADGRAYNFVIWQSNSGAFVDQNWVTNGYQHGVANTELKKLREGSALNIVFKVGFGKSTNEAEAVTFPLRTYTVRTVALVAPVISGVKDASGWDIPDNGYSVRNNVTVNGTAPAGQQVEIFDGAESKGKVTATGGTWLIPLNGLALNVLHSIKAVGQYGSNPASNVWRFTSVPEINASIDLIKETDTDKIIDQNGWTTRNAITVEGTANAYLKVQLYDNNVPISGAIATAGTNNKWTYQLTNLLDGAHTIKAKALYGGGSEASRMLNISKAASGLEDLTRDPSTTFPTNVEKRLTSGLVVKYISGDGRIGPYEGFPVMWCSNTQTHIQFDFAGGTEVKGISLGIFVQPDGWADGTISGTMNIYGKSGQLIASKHYSLVDELANNHHMFFRSETYFSRVTLTINPPSALVNFGITHFHWS